MEREVARLQRTLEELERNLTTKKQAAEKWVRETDAAIAEARQAAESRQQCVKQLQAIIRKTQVCIFPMNLINLQYLLIIHLSQTHVEGLRDISKAEPEYSGDLHGP